MLVIEDGSVVVGADSFISYADAVVQAGNLGLSFSDEEVTGQQQLRQAYIWLVNLYEPQLQGLRISKDQTGCFPRSGVEARSFAIDNDEIPADIISAQLFASSAINGGIDINTVKTTAELKSFAVDGVYTETYKDSDSAPSIANMPQVYNFMKPYTRNGGNLTLHREDYSIGNRYYEW